MVAATGLSLTFLGVALIGAVTCGCSAPAGTTGDADKVITIRNMNLVGTPADGAFLTLRVPTWAESLVGAPLVSRSIPGVSGAEIPVLHGPNGAELQINVGYLPKDTRNNLLQGPPPLKPSHKDYFQVGKWKGGLKAAVGFGLEVRSFHVVSKDEYARGWVAWPERNVAAQKEGETLLRSALETIRQSNDAQAR